MIRPHLRVPFCPPDQTTIGRPIGTADRPLVGLIDLCSTYSATPITTAELREISSAHGSLPIPPASRTRRSWTRLSDEARRDVAARYEAGETSTALAAEYAVAKSTILGILRSRSVVVRRQRPEPDVVGKAARLYESGLSLSQVAGTLKVNQETMRLAIIANGVELRPPSGR